MKCDRARVLLSARLDGELSGLARFRLERHLRSCAGCRHQLADLERLRARVRAELPRHAIPPELHERLRAQWQRSGAAAPRQTPDDGARRRWLAWGALAGSAATLAALSVGNWIALRAGRDELAIEAVDAHTRAILSGRTIEIASSDQHTVKPWLSARLDYSPPVHDLASEGFPLAGGRLETLGGRRVAALVYTHRLHTIDVFVRPEPAPSPRSMRAVRGFNVAHAAGGGMDFLAVSDVNAQDLRGFVERLAQLADAR